MNRHITKEEIWMANKHTKRWPTSLLARELPIETTNLSPHWMAIIRKMVNKEVLKRIRTDCNSHTVIGKNVNGAVTLEEFSNFLKS